MLLREIMTEHVVTASPATPARQVAELMRDRNVGSVVLAEGGRPVGMVTDRDLALTVLAGSGEAGYAAYSLAGMARAIFPPTTFVVPGLIPVGLTVLAGRGDTGCPAEECATTPVVTGEAEMPLEEAAALMVGHRIRRLPVMDGEELVGIVTLDDIAVRTGNLEVARQMTADVARAVFPEFYFHQRGG